MIVAMQLFFWKDKWRLAIEFPKNIYGYAYGSTIGFLATLIGVGGGAISVPILKLYNFEIHKAIGTAAGIGTIITIPGTIGFILAGISNEVSLSWSLGYVSLVGLLLITPLTMIGAPFGVRFAHHLSKGKLNFIFGLFLLIMSFRFFIEWISLIG
jgi:uncharacterized membrane protein YfcA